MTKVISTRVSDYISKELKIICKDTGRTRTFHVKKAIELYIQNHVDYQIALDRYNNPNDKVISGKEISEMLRL